MEVQIQAALISAAISLIAAISSIIFNIYQIRREKKKWLFELKTSYSEELYKARLATYPRDGEQVRTCHMISINGVISCCYIYEMIWI